MNTTAQGTEYVRPHYVAPRQAEAGLREYIRGILAAAKRQ